MSIASVAPSPVREDSLDFPRLKESIFIYLSVAGSVIPLHILESDSIASVKLKIQTSKGFFVKKQKLVFGGKELARDTSLIHDYGVGDGNVLHLVLRLSDVRSIIVRTVCGKKFGFHVDRSRNVLYVKQQIVKQGKGFLDLNDQELFCDDEELEDQRLVDDICMKSDSVIHLLVRKSAKVRANHVNKDIIVSIDRSVDGVEHDLLAKNPSKRDFILEPLTVNPKVKLPKRIRDLINATIDGLARGLQPIRSVEGSGGAYFMQDSSGEEFLSVFKPIDEEPMAINNPQGLPLSPDGEGLKKGTRVEEGALREVAAYLLDHPKCGQNEGFAGVPPTVMVKCLHEGFNHPDGYSFESGCMKIGSMQKFVKNFGSSEEMGPGAFPVAEVHKICVLDIRIANADRHAGNILISRDSEQGQIVLTPIDHGYCLPVNFEDCTFEWLYWPQACQPFSKDTVEYIKSLDADKDIELLKFHGWELPLECVRVLRISTMLLKKGAERGLNPHAIGSIMCRQTMKKVSDIEQIVQEAQEYVLPETSEDTFLESVSGIMDRYLDELYH